MTTTVTKTIKASGGDYSSLAAWISSLPTDLVGTDTIQQAEVYAFTDTTGITFSGFNVDATHYIRVYAAPGEGHSGYFDPSKQLLSVTNTNGITLRSGFVFLEGLQLQLTATNSSQLVYDNSSSAGLVARLTNCLLKGVISGGSGYGTGVYGYSVVGNSIIELINCAIWGFYNQNYPTSGSFGVSNMYSDVRMYNCTVYNCGVNVKTNSATYLTTVVNCVSFASKVADYSGAAGNYQNTSNNASGDSSAPGTSPLIGQTLANFAFVSTTETDPGFLDIGSASTLITSGVNNPLSGVYSTDIHGRTRS